jgi:hypothetical protein
VTPNASGGGVFGVRGDTLAGQLVTATTAATRDTGTTIKIEMAVSRAVITA